MGETALLTLVSPLNTFFLIPLIFLEAAQKGL